MIMIMLTTPRLSQCDALAFICTITDANEAVLLQGTVPRPQNKLQLKRNDNNHEHETEQRT